jgi:jumonji domain-containing protein 1C
MLKLIFYYTLLFIFSQILVEFDDVDWKKREWIRVYEQNAFQLFLLEYTLVWFNNKETSIGKNILWPSLVCLLSFIGY